MNETECKIFLCPCKLLGFSPRKRATKKRLAELREQYQWSS